MTMILSKLIWNIKTNILKSLKKNMKINLTIIDKKTLTKRRDKSGKN